MKVYLVGGAVRDRLLNLPIEERDWVVVGSCAQELLDKNYQQVGKDFPVFLHPQTHEEYALARIERKTAAGYHGFDVNASKAVTLEEDLLRRDLTINAIAEDEQGVLIDPYGGQKDIKNGLLRHVSPAFTEDPVRILRIARFAARFHKQGFVIADSTLTLMKEMVDQGEVNALVPERVWQELVKTLSLEHPRRLFEVLRECGALAVLLPELDCLFGVPQTAKWHPEIDTGVHTLMVLDQACILSQDPKIRFAAICHDLGKGETPSSALPSHHGHEAKSAKLTQQLCARLKVPSEYRDLAVLVAKYHSHCHKVFELKTSTLLRTLNRLDALRRPERFDAFLIACTADAKGRSGFEQTTYPQADYFRAAFAAMQTVDAREIARAGGKGNEIRERLESARLDAIKQWKTQYTH
jgi:tRNA nucleotidyltransferase (CCA-adding enzyme)